MNKLAIIIMMLLISPLFVLANETNYTYQNNNITGSLIVELNNTELDTTIQVTNETLDKVNNFILTLMGVFFSLGLILFGFLYSENIKFIGCLLLILISFYLLETTTIMIMLPIVMILSGVIIMFTGQEKK